MSTAVETAPARPEARLLASGLPDDAPPPAGFPLRLHDAWLVAALTLLGGVLRFSWLDRPPIWGDEAMTFMRVCGSYQQMLDALQDWGFAPLHYELYWWIGQQTALTPFMMRLVPAIAGTLMVPAMYWLGRELIGRKVGLLAALFAATSAYLLNYSRDAKMYMHFWLLCTVNVAALLWWLRARRGVAWWSWVASGVAMLGLNMLGMFVLGIELLAVVLARRAQWRSVGQSLGAIAWSPVLIYRAPYTRFFRGFRVPPLLLFLVGVAIMLIGPYGYYKHFNRYAERIERRGLAGGGLHWVEGYNRGRDTWDLIAFTATAHLYSWEWPRFNQKLRIDDAREIAPRVVFWLKAAGITLAALLAVGLFPWPKRWTAFGEPPPRQADAAADPLTPAGWPWPRALTLVAAWLVLPAYAFYLGSADAIASPPRAAGDLLQQGYERLRQPTFTSLAVSLGLLGLAAGALILCGRTLRERAFKVATLLTIAAGVFLLCWLMFLLYRREHEGSVWMPRYLGFAWPAVALAVAVLFLRLPTRPLRWLAIALLVGVNLGQYSARLFAGSEVPTPIMARDLLDSQPPDAAVRMYYNVRVAPSGAPGTGYLWSVPGGYYLAVLSGTPTTPDEMLQTFRGGGRFVSRWKRWNVTLLPLPQYVANDVRKNPHLARVITWENFTPRQTVPDEDPVLRRLGEGWRRAEEQIHCVRDHWTWRNLMTLRRRVYERVEPAPATAPATAPAGGW